MRVLGAYLDEATFMHFATRDAQSIGENGGRARDHTNHQRKTRERIAESYDGRIERRTRCLLLKPSQHGTPAFVFMDETSTLSNLMVSSMFVANPTPKQPSAAFRSWRRR